MEYYAENIKILRKNRKYTLEELAKICGMSKSHLWDCENKTGSISASLLKRLADAFGVTMDFLYSTPPDSEVKLYKESMIEYMKRKISNFSIDELHKLGVFIDMFMVNKGE